MPYVLQIKLKNDVISFETIENVATTRQLVILVQLEHLSLSYKNTIVFAQGGVDQLVKRGR